MWSVGGYTLLNERNYLSRTFAFLLYVFEIFYNLKFSGLLIARKRDRKGTNLRVLDLTI